MRKHIVVIENDQPRLAVITTNLEEAGYIVTGLQSFSSMQDLLFLRPDCFIINEWLPEISGHAICLMLKAKVQTRNTPVILISDLFDEEPRENRCDADLILKRPFQPYNLVQIVSLLIRKAALTHN
ncbi:MAG: response regulator transcription factor [Mucilaginibacter sp.]|nr:response regulator transcription factor [Mucilaginibacter sp.]